MSTQIASPPNESRVPITSILNPSPAEDSSLIPPHPTLEPPSCWFTTRPSFNAPQSAGYPSSSDLSPCLSSASSVAPRNRSSQGHRSFFTSGVYPHAASSKRRINGMEIDGEFFLASNQHCGPPTPPNEEFAVEIGYPYHTTPSASRPCTCASCKTMRHAAHADAHARYSADMSLLTRESGRFTLGTSSASKERFDAYFASLAPVDDTTCSTPSESQHSGYMKQPSTQSKKDAHKIKEKSRRDTVKSFMLSFSSMVPPALGPCTPHRFSKNNVEEPANVTVLDRAALYLTAQRFAFEGLVRDGRLSEDEVEACILSVLPEAGAFVQRALGRSEAYVGELRWHGIQNPSFEPETKGKKCNGGTKRRRYD